MSLNALPTNRLTLAQQMQAHTSKHPPPPKSQKKNVGTKWENNTRGMCSWMNRKGELSRRISSTFKGRVTLLKQHCLFFRIYCSARWTSDVRFSNAFKGSPFSVSSIISVIPIPNHILRKTWPRVKLPKKKVTKTKVKRNTCRWHLKIQNIYFHLIIY